MQRITITMPEHLLAEIDTQAGKRGERSSTMVSMLESYTTLLKRARRDCARMFTVPEQSLILDALNGSFFDLATVQFIPHSIADAMALDGLDRKWKVDATELNKKMSELSFSQFLALHDAVTRWWNRVGSGENSIQPMELFLYDLQIQALIDAIRAAEKMSKRDLTAAKPRWIAAANEILSGRIHPPEEKKRLQQDFFEAIEQDQWQQAIKTAIQMQ